MYLKTRVGETRRVSRVPDESSVPGRHTQQIAKADWERGTPSRY